MTFSVAGRCRDTGMLGVAITTSSISVGSRCPWARSGTGAVSTQNVTLPSIGTMVLDRIGSGRSAPDALSSVMSLTNCASYRQVIAIDANGATASYSGSQTLGTNAVHAGIDCIAAGNLLQSETLAEQVTARFETETGCHLAERLVRALESGLYEAGGEEGPVHSAALLVVDDQDWPLIDLRVDWNEADPVRELRSLWNSYEPQMLDYVTRALDPSSAPSYGVPGDE